MTIITSEARITTHGHGLKFLSILVSHPDRPAVSDLLLQDVMFRLMFMLFSSLRSIGTIGII
jgi:hypothetical protein